MLWLTEVGESRAAAWFNDNWTGERGNYTLAAAGYAGNNLSSGIESNWRFMRRDTVGNAGTTQRISLEVFGPSLMQYLSIRSKRHADKILCPKTGAHMFPSEATYITTKMWKKIQGFNVHRLLLSFPEASQHVRNIWAKDMEFFHSCGKTETFGEAITRFRAQGLTMTLARSATVGILIPTKHMMRDIENNHFPSFEEDVKFVDDTRNMFQCLYHHPETLDAEYGETSLEEKLDLMDSFVRVTPMPIKSGEMVFLCNCGDAYKYYGCVHSGVMSMLWNQDMTFPDTVRAHPLKAKEAKKKLNPFEAVAKRQKDRKEKEEPAPPASRVIWKPVLPAYSPPVEDSGASMGAKGTVPVLPPTVMHCLSFPTKRCFDGFS